MSNPQAVIAHYPEWLQPQEELEPLGNHGGSSGSQLWRYRSRAGWLVLRVWPKDRWTLNQLQSIHRWIKQTQTTGFTASPLVNSQNQSITKDGQGHYWELAPWLPGTSTSNPNDRELDLGFAGLAMLHKIWETDPQSRVGPSPGLIQRAEEIHWWRQSGFGELRAALSHWAWREQVIATLASNWLDLAQPLSHQLETQVLSAVQRVQSLQPILGDVHGSHLLFENNQLTGIIDYGAMCVDSAIRDLARLLSEWVGSESARRLIGLNAYEKIRPLSSFDRVSLAAFESSAALLIGGRWARWLILERRFELGLESAILGIRKSHERLLELNNHVHDQSSKILIH